MRATVRLFYKVCVVIVCCSVGLTGCFRVPRSASLSVDHVKPVAPRTPVKVCYTLPSGTQAAFIAPSLAGEPGFHDVTDTPMACETVRAQRTTTFTLQVVPEQGDPFNLHATLAVIASSRPTAVVTAVEAVANAGLCPSSIDVRSGIALRHGGPVTYHILLNGHTSGAEHRVRVPTHGNLSLVDELPFPAKTKATAAIAITAPARYVSRALGFNLPCTVIPPAQIAIWKRASAARCKPGSGYLGAGCARTVNQVIAQALGDSIPPGAPPFYCGGMRSAAQPWDPEAQHRCSITWVPDMVQMIEEHSQFGKALTRTQTVPGDIAVQDGTNPHRGMNHIGFCEDLGCHFVLSNQSSKGLLCGHTNATMSDHGYPYPPYYPPTFYRVYNVAKAIK